MGDICKNGVMESVADGNKEYKICHIYINKYIQMLKNASIIAI